MTYRIRPIAALLTLVAVLLAGGELRGEPIAPEVNRSPVDLVLGPDGVWLATANQTSDSVSLVRTADGEILDEILVGGRPTAIVLHPDGKTLLVSSAYGGVVQRLEVEEGKLHQRGAVEVGFHPHGIAISPDGKRAYVALAADAKVAVIDLEKMQVASHIEVGRWPRYVALSPDGSRLAVGTSGDRGVSVVDTAQGKMLYLESFVGMNVGHMQASADGQYAYFPWMVYRKNPPSRSNIQRGWVLASRIARVRLDGAARREAISLDPQGKAIADPHGIALTSDESRIVVSASGTRELLVFQAEGLPLEAFGSTDHIDPELLADKNRFYRIDLGGRPMGLRIGSDDRTVYVANYLENSVQVVDLQTRQVEREIFLGGAKTPSLERRGEAIFYDARYSLDQWYSCHSCHYEGGVNSERIDTLNDGSSFTFKTVLPLANLDHTSPWTWHGWQTDIDAAMRKSITSTMQGREPEDDEVEALLAYLRTLEPPPNPFVGSDGSLSAAAERGRKVFHSEAAGCATCHSGPYFTDGQIHDVGLEERRDAYDGFNTPSLIGVYGRVRYLHDGRVQSLEELLTGPHAPEKVAGTAPLSEDELNDLVAYLQSL